MFIHQALRMYTILVYKKKVHIFNYALKSKPKYLSNLKHLYLHNKRVQNK